MRADNEQLSSAPSQSPLSGRFVFQGGSARLEKKKKKGIRVHELQATRALQFVSALCGRSKRYEGLRALYDARRVGWAKARMLAPKSRRGTIASFFLPLFATTTFSSPTSTWSEPFEQQQSRRERVCRKVSFTSTTACCCSSHTRTFFLKCSAGSKSSMPASLAALLSHSPKKKKKQLFSYTVQLNARKHLSLYGRRKL